VGRAIFVLIALFSAFACASARADDPRLTNYPTTTTLLVAGQALPGSVITLNATVVAPGAGAFAVYRLNPDFSRTNIGGHVRFYQGATQIGDVQITPDNTTTVGFIAWVDPACVLAGLPTAACTFRYYGGNVTRLSVTYRIPAGSSGSLPFSATFSGDATLSQGSNSPVQNLFVGGLRDLYSIQKQGSSGQTELHILKGAQGYLSGQINATTGLQQSGTNASYVFALGDYNHDGILDLYVISKQGASGHTEVHVLDGSNGYQTYLAHIVTALSQTGSDNSWVFATGDYDRDGTLDLYAIAKQGGSGHTEVHVLSGVGGFQNYLAHAVTPLGQSGSDNSWMFALGDYDRDGVLDLYAIAKLGGSGHTDVHVLAGTGGFQTYLLHTSTPLAQTGTDGSWMFTLGDYNQDGVLDLYAIARQGGSGHTDVHVLNGTGNFQTYLVQAATPLPQSGTDYSWMFAVGRYTN
jgi:acyl-CoA-binding protein